MVRKACAALFAALLAGCAIAAPAIAQSVPVPVAEAQAPLPGVAAAMTTFYYKDMRKAAAWYRDVIGFKVFADLGWIVIFEVTPSMHIGLVTATDGSLRPSADKTSMVSIETDALDAWFARLKDRPGLNLIHGIQSGAKGMIREFRMYDPEGNQIEFFSWSPAANPRAAAPAAN